MSAEYLIEYNLKPGDPEYTDRPALYSSFAGRLHFQPNPQLDGRRAISVDTPEKQKELIHTGNIGVRSGGKPRFVIPSDLAGVQERERIRGVVRDYLDELGIKAPSGNGSHGEIDATEAAVEAAKEIGLDLKTVKGGGPGGRITKWDVTSFKARQL